MTYRLPSYFIDTYSKVILTQWSVLNHLIFDKTTTVKQQMLLAESADDGTTNPSLLSDTQLNDALNGPFASYFNQYIHAFSVVSRLMQQLTELNESIFNRTDTEKNDDQLDEIRLKKLSVSEIERIGKQLSDSMNEANNQWDEFYNQCANDILNQLQSTKLPVTETDIQDFNNRYTISELIGRMQDLRILVAGPAGESHFNFPEYFKLKSQCCIHGILSRQQQTNSEEDTASFLEKLTGSLQQMASGEQSLIDQHKKNIDEILKPIDFAKFSANQP